MYLMFIAPRNEESLRQARFRMPRLRSALLFGAALLLGCGAATQPPDVEVTLLPLSGATADSCVPDSQGDNTSCKDLATWKSYAETACKDKGLQLNNIDYAVSCGMGAYRISKYLCCPIAAPPTSMCTGDILGSDMSCQDEATWKAAAYNVCNTKGLWLSAYGTYDSCAPGLSRYVKYVCCDTGSPPPSPPNPPPPMSCTGDILGDAMSCKDGATWKTSASEACTAKGLKLGDYATYDPCDMGRFRHVKYVCCQ